VTAHGIYDHWNPSSPAILTGDKANISLDDLSSRVVSGRERRLLVLNTCDGAMAAVLGGIHRLGMAPGLTSRNQATISHLWPVEPGVAAAFGVLLALRLGAGSSFFESFEASLDELRSDWPIIADRIATEAPSTLADRIMNVAHMDMHSIFHWGSPCFLQ
jgi:hypothetical protein